MMNYRIYAEKAKQKLLLQVMIKWWAFGLIFCFAFYSGPEYPSAKAILLILLSLLLLFKARHDPAVFIAAFFIAYCNYSIAIGEYLIGGHLAAPFYEVRTPELYGELLNILLLFNAIVALCFNRSGFVNTKKKFSTIDNSFYFYTVLVVLILVFVLGIDRTPAVGYVVRITPLYEYSYILFLFAFFYAGDHVARRAIVVLLALAYIFQDVFYGGRITSVQIAFCLLLTVGLNSLSWRRIVLMCSAGILGSVLVGSLRSGGSALLQQESVFTPLTMLADRYAVFDTPVFSYYASATHLAASSVLGFEVRLTSFLYFIEAVFMGTPRELGNITSYVSTNLYFNKGGGVLPTHFFFWLGWLGVFLIGFLVSSALSFVSSSGARGSKSHLLQLLAIVVVVTVPRWYLYTPLLIFRPILLVTLLYYLSRTFAATFGRAG